MDEYMVILRILHITAGAFWVGAGAVFALFVEPTAAELGPAAGPFMGQLTAKRRLPVVIAIAALTTIVAGSLLYWRVSGGLNEDWITSGPGIGFTVGALAAISSFLVGFTVLRPGIDRAVALRQRLLDGEAAAGPALTALERRLRTTSRVNLSFLLVAVTAMAGARYL